MSASNKAKPHPDEDLLTAFAEQTLSPQEREAVFSHLAGCSRCREILFFAQQASAATTNQPKAATPPIAPRRLHWRTPVFAALGVAMIAAALSSWEFYRHTLRARAPLAKFEPPPVTNGSKPDGSKSVPPLPTAAAASEKAVPLLQPEAKAKSMSRHAASIPGEEANPSVPAARPESSPLRPSEEAAPAARGASIDSAAQALPSQQDSLLEVRSGFVNAPSPPLPAGQLFRLRDGAVEGWNGSEYKPILLPNGIKAASVAGRAQVLLALERDGAGVLYRSVDGGEHWAPVSTQWRGKAISVEIRRNNPTLRNLLPASRPSAGNDSTGPGITGRMVDPALQVSAGRPAEAVPRSAPAVNNPSTSMPVIFELRNDLGEQWLSIDQGKTWHPE